MVIVQRLFQKPSKKISFERFCKEVRRFTEMISRLTGGYCMMSESERYSAIEIGDGLFVVVINEIISSTEVKEKAYCITTAKNWREAIQNIKT